MHTKRHKNEQTRTHNTQTGTSSLFFPDGPRLTTHTRSVVYNGVLYQAGSLMSCSGGMLQESCSLEGTREPQLRIRHLSKPLVVLLWNALRLPRRVRVLVHVREAERELDIAAHLLIACALLWRDRLRGQ